VKNLELNLIKKFQWNILLYYTFYF
jgi:hypothetical protein